jgi:cytochrome P450
MRDRLIDAALVDPYTYANERAYHELFRRLRRDDPVHWTKPRGFGPFWTLSKHGDIIEVERQNRLFLNSQAGRLMSSQEVAALRTIPGLFALDRSIVSMDEPDHRTYRRLTQDWFMPTSLARLQAEITALAQAAVDEMAGLGDACDFVQDVAAAFPLRVIMRILGIPAEDEPYILDLSRKLFAPIDTENDGVLGAPPGPGASHSMVEYFTAITAERRRRPCDDVASVIANSVIDDRPIPEIEAASYYLILVAGGHHTTTGALAGGLLALIENPAEMRKLRDDQALMPSAVHEILRYVAPIKQFFRRAAEDYKLRGRQIRAGDLVMLCYPSANRDEEVFDEPFAFRIERPNVRSLAFGHGVHACLGQHLANLQMRLFFRALLDRFKHIELAGEPVWTVSSFMAGPKRLPVRYEHN